MCRLCPSAAIRASPGALALLPCARRGGFSFWLGWWRKVEFPRLADQRGKLFLGDAIGLNDHICRLAPHIFDEGLGIGLEQKLLPLIGQMQIEPIGPDHREDALLGAERRPCEVIDLTDAVERECDLADVGS